MSNDLNFSLGNLYDPKMEAMIKKGGSEILETAKINGRITGIRNIPASVGDQIAPYIGDIKAKCEKLMADVNGHLQPEAQFPEAKMDADYFREKVGVIETEIKEKEAQNQSDESETRSFDKSSLPTRFGIALIVTLIMYTGDATFIAKSFQVTGENLLVSLILSIGVSVTVFAYSHMAPFLYKGAKSQAGRRKVVYVSLLGTTIVFVVLAIFRATYLANHDVHINPINFVIINLFFFIVSTLISFFMFPTWEEFKENTLKLKILFALKKRRKEVERLKKEIEKIKLTILERTKLRLRIAHQANYAAERIRKIYDEAIGVFITTNLQFRTDGKMPDCFINVHSDLDISDFNFTILPPNNLKS
ncbi:MAG: hypothetical protein WC755_06305 [Candidatus Woesearchaeota archaeon]|jgi:hypothetical protein